MTRIELENYNYSVLDDVGLKIILELRRDGRASAAKIAQKLGISLPTVNKRLKDIVNDGIVTIRAFPNPERIGYQAEAFIGLNVSLKDVERISKQIMGIPKRRGNQIEILLGLNINLTSNNVLTRPAENSPQTSIINGFGKFDIIIVAYFLDWSMLHNFVNDELPGIKGINYIETYIISEVKKRNEAMLSKISSDSKSLKLDEIDRRLINALMINGRPNYSHLAKQLGISNSTASRRISYLTKENIIRILAVPDPSKIGNSFHNYVVLKTYISDVDKICDHLSKYPEIHTVMKLMNGYNILLGISTIDIKALYDLITNNIANLPGIISYEVCVCYFYNAHTNTIYFDQTDPRPGTSLPTQVI